MQLPIRIRPTQNAFRIHANGQFIDELTSICSHEQSGAVVAVRGQSGPERDSLVLDCPLLCQDYSQTTLYPHCHSESSRYFRWISLIVVQEPCFGRIAFVALASSSNITAEIFRNCSLICDMLTMSRSARIIMFQNATVPRLVYGLYVLKAPGG